jgi:Tfp pilus assembly protein PilF
MYAEGGGNLDTALQLAQVARQKVPESAEIADTVGWVYVKKNMGALALSHFEHALARDPQSPLYTYHLGLALAQTGQKIKARQSLEKALTLNPDAQTAAKVRAALDQL